MTLLLGKFEPPRSSDGDYFANSNCTFHFKLLEPNVRLLIWYDYFNIADDDYARCAADNLTYTSRSWTSAHYSAYPHIYCGYRNYPPPYLTARSVEQLRVHFRTNNDSETGLGFDGRYEFIDRTYRLFSPTCASPFDAVVDIDDRTQPSGNLSSNGYPENTICEWSYRAMAALQFKLELTVVDLEGSQTKDPPQGCQSSVLRIFSADRVDELCGLQEAPTFVFTKSNWFTVQFISLQRQTREALQGFHLTWTVIQLSTDGRCPLRSNDYLDCRTASSPANATAFCIHRSLMCDGQVHCQPLSNADEPPANCSETSASHAYLVSFSFLRQHYILFGIVVLLVITTVGIGFVLVYLIVKSKETAAAAAAGSKESKSSPPTQSYPLDGDDAEVTLIRQTVTSV